MRDMLLVELKEGDFVMYATSDYSYIEYKMGQIVTLKEESGKITVKNVMRFSVNGAWQGCAHLSYEYMNEIRPISITGFRCLKLNEEQINKLNRKKLALISENSYEDLLALYHREGLKTVQERIDFLRKGLGIFYTTEQGNWTDDDRLRALEETVVKKEWAWKE